MGIAKINLAKIRESAGLAAESQWEGLGRLRQDVSRLEVRALAGVVGKMETYAVAAADAGLVSVELSPFSLEFLFVADDRERVHLSEVFPLTTMARDMESIFERTPVLLRFARRLNLEWRDLTRLWEREVEAEPPFPRDVRLVSDMLRELAEWAVCFDLAEEAKEAKERKPRLVLHDGLLRSILLRSEVIRNRLPEYWEESWRRHGAVIAGVGKSSYLWQRLAVALDMDERIQAADECYVVVPPEVEELLSGRTMGGGGLGFGQLVLLKTRLHDSGFFLPIDLPAWIVADERATGEVLAEIARVSQRTFPRPGYPGPLSKAHEFAHLTAFDAKVIRDQVVEALHSIMPGDEFERLRRGWAFQPAAWEKTGRIGKL